MKSEMEVVRSTHAKLPQRAFKEKAHDRQQTKLEFGKF